MNDDGRSGISNAAEHAAEAFREAEKQSPASLWTGATRF